MLNISEILHSDHTMCFCDFYGTQNKQHLFPYSRPSHFIAHSHSVMTRYGELEGLTLTVFIVVWHHI